MKKLLLILLLLQIKGYGQSIINGNFESWTTTPYEEPDGWYSSNLFTLPEVGISNATKVTGQSGSAIMLETEIIGSDTAGAYFTNTLGDPLSGEGGVPYSQMPTDITGYYKYNTVGNDTALLMVSFKSNGVSISFDIFKITGTQGTFTAFSFPLNLLSTPDTVIIAAASSNLIDNIGVEDGSYLVLDELAFAGSGITQPIPNGDFDNWTTLNFDLLNDWGVSGAGVAKTMDNYKGDYALTLQTIDYGGGDISASGITSGQYTDSSTVGGQPFTNMVDTLMGYYKYITSGSDTAVINVSLYSNGTGTGWYEYYFTADTNYTYFEIPINESTTPDTMRIDIASSKWPYTNAVDGSTLYLDELQLKSQPLTTGIISPISVKTKNLVYPNPVKESLTIKLNSGFTTASLDIYDVAGRKVYAEVFGQKNLVKLNTSFLDAGIYFYELRNADGTILRDKFIKE